MQFLLVGWDSDGNEIYETSEEVKRMSIKEKKARMNRLLKEELRGRTAKFIRNGRVYYAQLHMDSSSKAVYGDKKSDSRGYAAKLNTGADGYFFELIENALFSDSRPDSGKETGARIHKNTKSWDYYVKTVKIDGQYYDVLINISDQGNDQYIYDITLRERGGEKK